jgi:HD-GYP domain-containing protein (c-di-GMP phosphodiesterase class II)
MARVRVKDGDIVFGKPIPWNCFDQNGVLFLRKGQVIKNKKQIESLLNIGLYHFGQNGSQSSQVSAPVIQSPFELLNEIQTGLDVLFDKIIEGTVNKFHENVLLLCEKIQQSCNQDEDATIGNMFLYKEYKYTIRHPVNVAVVCEIVSKHLKWTVQERLPLLAAALTMNVGILKLQDKLYSQKELLADVQRLAIREHPEHGVEMLSQAGISNKVWIEGVLYHHEAIDGSGYPSGLKGNAIPMCARIIAIGDRYCAGVSRRSYRLSLAPQKSMKGIYLNAGKETDPDIVNLCVRLLGVYPPGTFVRLANGETAVVTSRGEKAHTPIVHSIVKSNRKDMFLGPMKRDSSKDDFSIVEIVSAKQEKLKINPYQLWGYFVP